MTIHLNLSKHVKKIKILQRHSYSRSIKLLQKRVKKSKNIQVIKNQPIKRISLNNEKITLFSDNNIFESDLVIVAIGRYPNLSFLENKLDIENYKQIKSKFFIIGDANVKNRKNRQISIAMGEGIKAAMEIINTIET